MSDIEKVLVEAAKNAGATTVWVLTYEHKHGLDCGAYRTERGAEEAARQLALESAEDRWDKGDFEKLKAIEDPGEAVHFFNETELEWAYSEVLDWHERPLGD